MKSQLGCGYVDFRSEYGSIACADVACKQLATVICQKLPTQKTQIIQVKRSYNDEPTDDELDDQKSNGSIGRNFAPVFFILGVAFALILLALINVLYQQYQKRKINNKYHGGKLNNDSVYFAVSTANEFDLN
ncbi:unnamed protein product [Adineta steineri]|uniref:SRCR domain-containing protein n=1 Tax=Adineta steineri TaxID=433720 RepID=A0A815S267_9BILA|nr:unnamed protein product [Adineta steineri]CAF4249172.1 unnamed protein product [Adineta steineri]